MVASLFSRPHGTAFHLTLNASRQQITDERLDLLGSRFQANRIFNLMGLTFGEYLESPQQYDQIVAHLEAGGGCRVEGEQYIINQEVRHA